jgi:3-hydroxyisobutyrate dehydrogenase
VARRIGFVGLGRMGLPMAARLAAAGFEVRGFDIAAPARAAFQQAAGGAADSLAAAAEGADAVILMLPDSKVIAEVTHRQGLLAAMRPGSLLIDMSSSEPAKTEELARDAEPRGIRVVGAPVSGGVTGAERGTLTIMAGGDPGAVNPARPILDALGSRVIHVGDAPGAGHALKALNNLLAAVTMLATSEAMLAGQRFGLDPAVMLDVLNTSTGRSFASERNWPEHVLTRGYDSGFAMRLLVKDALIGLGIARSAGTGSALAEEAVGLWRRAATWLPDAADHTEIVRWLEHTRQGAADYTE